MTVSEVIERIVQSPAQAPKLLAQMKETPGLSKAFFDEVYRLFVEDHSSLTKLSSAAKWIVRYGDDAALGYRSLGIITRMSGKWSASAEAFQLAGASATNPVDKLAFQIGAIDGLARAGKVDEAVSLGNRIAKGLSRLPQPGLAARARLNVGYALMQQDRYREASHELAGLADILNENGFAADASSSRVALSTSQLFGGDPVEARKQAQLASDEAEQLGSRLLSDIAKGNVAYTHILSGDVDLAVADLLVLKHHHEQEPIEMARVLEYLGDALSAMNLFMEAADAYREAEALGVHVSELHRAHLQYGIGQAISATGRLEEARRHWRSASRRYRSIGNLPWHAATEMELANLEFKLGLESASKHLKSSLTLARQVCNPYHLSRALLISAENGGPIEDLMQAIRMIRSQGLVQNLWRALAELARRQEGGLRLRTYRKMFSAILADQARTSSVSGRLSFFVDKQAAIRSYLDELLARPTESRITEATQVILQTRSVTLLDEVLLSQRVRTPGRDLSRLSRIREELNQGRPSLGMEGSRRSVATNRNIDHLQRIWLEETHSLMSFNNGSPQPRPIQSDTYLFIADPSCIRILHDGSLDQIPLGEMDLERTLDWLNFDIVAPLADPNSPPTLAMDGLKGLGKTLLRRVIGGTGTIGICPDGQLWRVPWLACLEAIGEQRDLEIRLHPGLRGKLSMDRAKPAMIWVAEHDDLPRASEEADEFLKIYPNAIICRSAKDVCEVLGAVDVSVLHVISHSRYRPNHPMFSSLDFTDGPVLAAEIARSGLRAELVTLSGCDTARLSGLNRLEPDGLVRAFLACGAGYVVGSAWPLDDEAAMKFFSAFYRAFDLSANINESLRQGRDSVRQWRSHPYYWAFPLLYAGYCS